MPVLRIFRYFWSYKCSGVKELGKSKSVKKNSFIIVTLGFPRGSVSKESACNAGDLGLIPGLGRSPGKGNNNPLQYSCWGKSHAQRSLVDYSPWGHMSQTWLSNFTTTIDIFTIIKGLKVIICFKGRNMIPNEYMRWTHEVFPTLKSVFHN